MVADAKPPLAQNPETPKEADQPPKKTFRDYARSAGSWAKDYVMDPRRLPSIGRELAYAVTDIRQKVVEEGMYGKVVTPQENSSDERRHTTVELKRPEPKGDPLGRTGGDGESKFKQRCREAFEKGGKGPDGPDRGPERGPER